MIPDDKIAEVRERAGIVEVISDYIGLKKSGANYLGLCPFHGEKTPSFNVNPARGIFHCFGCGVGGNVVTFVMKMEGLSFPEAVKLLAKRVGVTIEERLPTAAEKLRLDEREQQLAIVALAAEYYGGLLLRDRAGEPGRRYLVGRGVEGEILSSYRLGYASERWDGLSQYLRQKGGSLEQAERLGLIKVKSSGGYYDLFRNRLIFTIANVHGQPIAFGGRVLDDSLPKYINSPESPLYNKSETLFGIDLAKQAMREQKGAIIVEGYFDHLALYRAGIRNVVATCGTALTGGHLQVIKRYADRIYLLFDADSAGKKATMRGMELILEAQLSCLVVEMPAGEDPDSFLASHSAEEFAELLAKSRPALDYYLRELLGGNDTGTVAGKKTVIDAFRPMVQKLADPLERDLYLRELSRLLGIPFASLAGGERSPSRPAPAKDDRRTDDPAHALLALLARYPEIAATFRASGVMALLPPELEPLAGKLLGCQERGETVDFAAMIAPLAETEQGRDLAGLLMDDSHLADIDPFKALQDFHRALERHSLRQLDGKSLRRELQHLDSDSPRYWEIMELLNGLRNKKSQLL
jgi:DNA primase